MHKMLELQLRKSYSSMLAGYLGTFNVPDGWYQTLELLFSRFAVLLAENEGSEIMPITVNQNNGRLSFRAKIIGSDAFQDDVIAAIQNIEQISASVCQACGSRGYPQITGRDEVGVYCDGCYNNVVR